MRGIKEVFGNSYKENYRFMYKIFRMKTTIVLSTIILLACADKVVVEPVVIPTIELVATHAIDTPTQISSLTFVPNNVAPWLGRIILLDNQQRLLSTDIEGRTPLEVNAKSYIDIEGVYRENQVGVFLALTTNGTLEAFIQSDDAGNYTSLPISGTGVNIVKFCKSSSPEQNTVNILSQDGYIVSLNISVLNGVLEYTETSKTKAAKDGLCQKKKGMSSVPLQFTGAEYLGTANGNLHFIRTDQEAPLNLIINDGLSIKGLEGVDYINATTANYGGGAFKGGVIALIDNDESRIVFISLDYADGKVTGASPS